MLSFLLTVILTTTTTRATSNCPNATTPRRPCPTIYPSSIQILNSLYPANETAPTRYFQLTNQVNHTSGFRLELASQVQFLNIPVLDWVPSSVSSTSSSSSSASSSSTNRTPRPPQNCTLQLQLPPTSSSTSLSTIQGPNPIIDIYNIATCPGVPATWNSFLEARTGTSTTSTTTGAAAAPILGSVDGTPENLKRVRKEQNGIVKVATVPCNETLTFQMAIREPMGAPWLQYWGFLDVVPPAGPVQGWGIVVGC